MSFEEERVENDFNGKLTEIIPVYSCFTLELRKLMLFLFLKTEYSFIFNLQNDFIVNKHNRMDDSLFYRLRIGQSIPSLHLLVEK